MPQPYLLAVAAIFRYCLVGIDADPLEGLMAVVKSLGGTADQLAGCILKNFLQPAIT